jgi:hypothetical protein
VICNSARSRSSNITCKPFKREVRLLCALSLIGSAMHIWGSHESLDIRFYYSADEAKSFFQNLSPSETRAYLQNEFFDVGFFVTYSFLLFCWFQRVYRAYPRHSFIALIPGMFDLVETSVIIAVLVGLIKEPPTWLGMTTCLKWTTGAFFVLTTAFQLFKQHWHWPAKPVR